MTSMQSLTLTHLTCPVIGQLMDYAVKWNKERYNICMCAGETVWTLLVQTHHQTWRK